MSNPLVDAFLPPSETSPAVLPNFRWGVVISEDIGANTVMVKLDGDEFALPASVKSINGRPTPNARVLVLIHNRRATILGTVNELRLQLGDATDQQATLILQRLRGSTLHEGWLYMPESSGGTGDVSLLSRVDGVNQARLTLGSNGQLRVNTYEPTLYRPLPFAVDEGSVVISGTGSNTTTASVTFTSGRFTKTPRVMATLLTASTAAAFAVSASSASSSGCTIRLTRDAEAGTFNSNYSVSWLAVQMEA